MGDGDNKEKGGIMVGIKGRQPAPVLLPAYHAAERRSLSLMQDAEAARYVGDRLGEAFNIEDHAAIAAYLYAFTHRVNLRISAVSCHRSTTIVWK